MKLIKRAFQGISFIPKPELTACTVQWPHESVMINGACRDMFASMCNQPATNGLFLTRHPYWADIKPVLY